MDYRRAGMIELHDAKIIIREKEFENYWSEYVELGEKIVLEGIDMEKLFKRLDIEIASHAVYANDICIRKYKNIFGDGKTFEDTSTILKLEVKIESPTMLLIKTTFDNHNDAEMPTFIQEVTYCGNYTIWWPETDSALQAAE